MRPTRGPLARHRDHNLRHRTGRHGVLLCPRGAALHRLPTILANLSPEDFPAPNTRSLQHTPISIHPVWSAHCTQAISSNTSLWYRWRGVAVVVYCSVSEVASGRLLLLGRARSSPTCRRRTSRCRSPSPPAGAQVPPSLSKRTPPRRSKSS